jgi:hypothetical protein
MLQAANRLMIKSLNYVLMGDLESALVEGRRLDLFLRLLRDERHGKDAYLEDAFLSYWTGMLYEAAGETNDAFIAYRNALALYREQSKFTGVTAPGEPAFLGRAYGPRAGLRQGGRRRVSTWPGSGFRPGATT